MYTHKWTYHSANGESPGSRRQLIAASVPKRRFGLCSISVYKHSTELQSILTHSHTVSLICLHLIQQRRLLTWKARNNKRQTLHCSSALTPGGGEEKMNTNYNKKLPAQFKSTWKKKKISTNNELILQTHHELTLYFIFTHLNIHHPAASLKHQMWRNQLKIVNYRAQLFQTNKNILMYICPH